jgi:hypothetical protein
MSIYKKREVLTAPRFYLLGVLGPKIFVTVIYEHYLTLRVETFTPRAPDNPNNISLVAFDGVIPRVKKKTLPHYSGHVSEKSSTHQMITPISSISLPVLLLR